MSRFYKKIDPRQPIIFSDGAWYRDWEVAGERQEIGLLQTSDGHIIKELALAIEKQRGGVREITAEEYQAIKKKQPKLKRWQPSNEAITMRAYLRLRNLWQGVAAGAVDGVELGRPQGGRKIERPVTLSTFRPASVRR